MPYPNIIFPTAFAYISFFFSLLKQRRNHLGPSFLESSLGNANPLLELALSLNQNTHQPDDFLFNLCGHDFAKGGALSNSISISRIIKREEIAARNSPLIFNAAQVMVTSPEQRSFVITSYSQVALVVKNPPAAQDTWAQALGPEAPLVEEMAAHSSILAWRISHTEEPDGWVTKTQTPLKQFIMHTCYHIDLAPFEMCWGIWPTMNSVPCFPHPSVMEPKGHCQDFGGDSSMPRSPVFNSIGSAQL